MNDPKPHSPVGILRRFLGSGAMLVTILISVGVFAVIHVRRCRQEQSALSELLQIDDGREYVLSYANPLESGDRILPEEAFSGGPEWVTRLIGVDPFKTTGALACVAPGNSFSFSTTIDGQLLIDRTYQSGIVDQEVELICEFTNLRSLALEANPISDSGVKQLASLSLLENLNLSNTQITDDALKIIAKLPRLRSLSITHTHVSDQGIKTLVETPTLEILDVTMTRVTSKGVIDLKKNLPDCIVVRQ